MSKLISQNARKLTAAQFQQLSDVPPEMEWFANIDNKHTRAAYQNDIKEFTSFLGIQKHDELRQVTRAHIIAWRKNLESRTYEAATIRRKLSALSSLFNHLCECNAVTDNPSNGVKRPKANNNEGKTPALGDAQARLLLDAPVENTLKGKRDRAILATLLYHGLRRDELCRLQVKDVHSRKGVPFLEVFGKGSKIRYVPLHPHAGRLIVDYLDEAGHREAASSPLFRPTRNNHTKKLDKAVDASTVYRLVKGYGEKCGITKEVIGLCTHSMRATAATNALDHQADIAKVKEWLGHANISTTMLYDHRASKPEDSPTFRVKY